MERPFNHFINRDYPYRANGTMYSFKSRNMTAYQTEIDWKNIVHGHENNSHSEQILEDEYERLNKNCKKLYEALRSGGKWTGKRIVTELDMMEYRRRIKDLKEAGIFINEEKIRGGCKQWWI